MSGEPVAEVSWSPVGVGPVPQTFVSVAQSSRQTIPHDVWTTLTLDSESYDLGDEFAGSVFTPKQSGVYTINAQVSVSSGSAAKSVFLRAVVGGATVAYNWVTGIAGSDVCVTISKTLYMTVGSSLSLGVFDMGDEDSLTFSEAYLTCLTVVRN